jgi:hypothetical protein
MIAGVVALQQALNLPRHPVWCASDKDGAVEDHEIHREMPAHAEAQNFDVGISVVLIQYDEAIEDPRRDIPSAPKLEMTVVDRTSVDRPTSFDLNLEEARQVVSLLQHGLSRLEWVHEGAAMGPVASVALALGWTAGEPMTAHAVELTRESPHYWIVV